MMPAADQSRVAAPTTLVLGLGATGRSIVDYLGCERALRVADTRTTLVGIDALRKKHEVLLGPFVNELLDGIDTVFVSPGLAPHDPLLVEAAARGLALTSDVDLFVAANDRPVIAVTGTNGKSTVVSLTRALLQSGGVDALAGGNLGTPVLDLLAAPGDVVVLELSSFQLARTSTLPALAATVLNISEDHLDWHGDLAAYRAAKQRVYRDADRLVINRRDPQAVAPDRAVTTFGVDAPDAGHWGVVEADGEHWLARGDEKLMPVAELYSALAHDIENALAALALVDAFALPRANARRALRDFVSLPHRAQPVATVAGVTWINDSKATNPGAALSSLASIDGSVVWIAGGDAKGADLTSLAAFAAERVRASVLLGEAAAALCALLPDGAAVVADSMADAVSLARQMAEPGDTVLLAPGCASHDMFRDYAARGVEFEQAVRELES